MAATILGTLGTLFFQNGPIPVTGQTGYLRVRAIDQFGQDIAHATFTIQAIGDGASATSAANWKNGDKLAFGTYLVRSEASGLRRGFVRVRVRDVAEVALVCNRFVGLTHLEGDSGTKAVIRLSRDYEGCPSARLLSIYDAETSISGMVFPVIDRSFTVNDLPSGDYAVLIYGPRGVCHTAGIRVTHKAIELIDSAERNSPQNWKLP